MSDLAALAGRRPRILAVANQKGGVGKTTTAINLGTGLAEAGRKCLIVDLDPQGNASTGLGVEAGARVVSIFDVLVGDKDIADSLVASGIDNLWIVPATVDLAGVDPELASAPDRAFRLRRALRERGPAQMQFDVVLIDCPPSLNLLTVNALAAADGILVPLQCEFFALEGLSQLLATVRQIQQGVNPGLRVEGIVLTMFDRRNRLSFQVEEDVRSNLGDIVFQTVVPRNVRLSEAPSFAQPALIYDRECAGSQAYRALVGELLGRHADGAGRGQ